MPEATNKPSWNLLTHIQSIGIAPLVQGFLYRQRRRRQDARFARPVRTGTEWQRLGVLQSMEQDAAGITLQTESGALRLDVLAEDCLRVRVAPDGEFPAPFSYAVCKEQWVTPDFTVQEDEESITLLVGDVQCRILREGLKLTVADGSGQIIYEDTGGPAWNGPLIRLGSWLAPHESGHGLGERAFSFNLRGREYALWNADPAGYNRGDDPINLSIPLYVGLRGQRAYGLFWDNSARGRVAMGVPEAEDELLFSAEDGELRYYLFTGPEALSVLERYTELTGRMTLPPLWALGYHQCRWSYMSAREVQEIAAEFRQREIPCDALYLDIDYMDGFRCFTWNTDSFPDPTGLIDDLREQGFRTVVMIDPGIKADHRYEVCKSGIEHDAFLKYPDGDRFVAPVWPGNCYFPDFTKPSARTWWGALYADLLDKGVAGVWNDMNEPALFSSSPETKDMPDYLSHDVEGRGDVHLNAHNIYGMQMVRASRDGLESLQPERRHVLITRSGFAGVQRYASSWTADNGSTWDHLRLSITMCLNLGLSGLTFTGPDIGGFAGDASGELFTRWVQAGVGFPFFRGHSAKWTGRHEPWAFGPAYEAIIRRYIELRYRLLPYIYTAFAEAVQSGWPIIRPLALFGPDLADCDDQYVLGNNVMVAPVVQPGATTRTVRFPAGIWYDYWAGNRFEGEKAYEVVAPLETLPLFVRAGSVIPHWPAMPYTGAQPIDELELRIYAGQGHSKLYEDAGEGKAYLDGEYRWSEFTCDWKPERQLTVLWQSAGPYQPPYDRVRAVVAGLSHRPKEVRIDGQVDRGWRFEGGQLLVSAPPFARLDVLL